MDDIPLWITQMQHRNVAALLDRQMNVHDQRKGVSVGERCVVWLAHILSPADHRLNRVQAWVSQRMETLRGCGSAALNEADLTDDRLAEVLRWLSHDEDWRPFAQELMGQLVRVYDRRPPACASIRPPPAGTVAMGPPARSSSCSAAMETGLGQTGPLRHAPGERSGVGRACG